MYTGYKMYEWQKKGIAFTNKKVVIAIQLIGAALLFYLPHVITMLNTDDVSLTTKLVYQAVFRVYVSSIIALIIMTSANTDGMLQWNTWVFLGKISYSVFLIHLKVLHLLVGVRTQLDHLHFLTFLLVEFGIYVLSCMLAVPFYTLIEAPLNPLIKILMSSSENKKISEASEKQKSEIADIPKKLGESQEKNDGEKIQNNVNEKVKSL